MSAIAIVGMACRYPDAASPDELWENVLAQRRSFRRLPAGRLPHDYEGADGDRAYCLRAAVLDGWEFDRARFGISGTTYRSTDLAHWLALEVAAAALADAGHPDGDGLPRERTLVVVGNTLTGEFSRANGLRLRWPYVRRVVAGALEREGWSDADRSRFLAVLEEDFKAPFAPMTEDTLAGGLANTIAGRICNVLDLKGGGYAVDGACASSLLAVCTAADALARGDVDVAVAGGVDLSLDPFELAGFSRVGALAPEEMRVYDRHSQGFWPGEGCGFVVLRRAADVDDERAVRLAGWGVSSDGTGGITRPELAGQTLAVQRAYERAGFGIDTVSYFEGHGTGTAVGDATELATLDGARRAAAASRPAAIGSVKANIGHTKAAAGIAGVIKAALAVREEVVPPTTGCRTPHPLLDGATIAVTTEPAPFPRDLPVRAAVSAMGFGGINTHLVLEGAATPRRLTVAMRERLLAESAQDAELFLFAGPSAADDVARTLAESDELSLGELGDLAAALAAALGPAPAAPRVAVVAATPSELTAGLRAAHDALAAGVRDHVDDARGVAIGSRDARVGLLFTGQGAAAPADAGALGRRFRVVREVVERAGLAAAADRVDTAFAQPAIVAASLAGCALLERLDLEASVAVGHSLGELSALAWADALAGDDAVAVAKARGRAMAGCGGGMLALAASPDAVHALIDGTDAVVAAINGAERVVVSGPKPALAEVQARATAGSVHATPLRVSCAFHSPLVDEARTPLADALARVEIEPPARRIVSTVTGEPLGVDTDVAALLDRQVTEPVRFLDALRAADADLFVEVGPGESLATLARETVGVPVVALDVGGTSLRPALSAAGALFAAGAIDPSFLFAGRATRPFRLGRPRGFLTSPCEAGPTTADPEPAEAAQVESAGPLDAVRGLVAERTELPLDAVRPDARLLGDLHLSSIAVAELAAAAARRLGVAAPDAPADLASATVAELADALRGLAAVGDAGETGFPEGVDGWVRPFEHVLVPRAAPPGRATPTTWTVLGPAGRPLVERIAAALAGEGEEHGVALVLPAGAEPLAAALLLDAARELRRRGAQRFALLEEEPLGAAFARVLRVESRVDVCVVRGDGESLAAHGRTEAETTSGWREVELGAERRVPILQPLDPTPVGWPLEPGSVLLVSGGAKGIGFESALALATKHDLVLALLGRADAGDGEVQRSLARLRDAGVRHAYVRADVADAGAVADAVRAAERELGPISALLHSAGVNDPTLIDDLDVEQLQATLRPKVTGFDNIVAALDDRRLRLVVAYGSVLAHVGVRGEAHYSLANAWLARRVETFAAAHPQCWCLVPEWSIWSGAGMGEKLGAVASLGQAGIAAIAAEEGTRLLDELICSATPASVVVSGRLGRPSTAEFARPAAPPLRFANDPLLEYGQIELIADTELSLATDPYLADHALDGVPLLPAVVGLEAMAQAATALGASVDVCTGVELSRPVTIPRDGATRIRVAALRRPDGAVDVVLRSDESAYAADHFRCTFGVTRAPGDEIDVPAEEPPLDVDVADVYDAVLFHGPRFRRVVRYSTLTATTCRATIHADAGAAWFPELEPQQLVLGDFAAHDAIIHVLQPCIPHRRVLPVGLDSIVRSRALDGDVAVVARERDADGTTFTWDIDVFGAAGALCESWRGLRLRAVGPTAAPAESWPPALLAPYVERRVAELAGTRIGVAVAAGGDSDAAMAAAAHRPLAVARRHDGRPIADGLAVSATHVDGYTLAVAGDTDLACDLETADHDWATLLGAGRLTLASRLAADLHEAVESSAARVWAAVECSRKAGRAFPETLSLVAAEDDRWALLRAGDARIATYVGRVDGVGPEVALAVLVEGRA